MTRTLTYVLPEDVRSYVSAGWRVVEQDIDLSRVHVSIIVEWPWPTDPEFPNADRA